MPWRIRRAEVHRKSVFVKQAVIQDIFDEGEVTHLMLNQYPKSLPPPLPPRSQSPALRPWRLINAGAAALAFVAVSALRNSAHGASGDFVFLVAETLPSYVVGFGTSYFVPPRVAHPRTPSIFCTGWWLATLLRCFISPGIGLVLGLAAGALFARIPSLEDQASRRRLVDPAPPSSRSGDITADDSRIATRSLGPSTALSPVDEGAPEDEQRPDQAQEANNNHKLMKWGFQTRNLWWAVGIALLGGAITHFSSRDQGSESDALRAVQQPDGSLGSSRSPIKRQPIVSSPTLLAQSGTPSGAGRTPQPADLIPVPEGYDPFATPSRPPANAQGKSPTDLFSKLSPSIVVVDSIDTKGVTVLQGSGVQWAAHLVATNCHVVQGANRIVVKSASTTFVARVAATDFEHDVCLLYVRGLPIHPAIATNTSSLLVGSTVYAIGAPEGLDLTFANGIISSLRAGRDGRFIQTTAPISPGSSGGGLFDDHGNLIGLTSYFFKEGQQLNFALPADWISKLSSSHPNINHEEDWDVYAGALANQMDWSALKRFSSAWVNRDPNNPEAWFALAEALGSSGDQKDAVEYYAHALMLDPDDQHTLNNLAIGYAQLGEADRAIHLAERATQDAPDEPISWETLGYVYAMDGDIQNSIAALKRAISLKPAMPQAWYVLSIDYVSTGDMAHARDAYNHVKTADPMLSKQLLNYLDNSSHTHSDAGN